MQSSQLLYSKTVPTVQQKDTSSVWWK